MKQDTMILEANRNTRNLPPRGVGEVRHGEVAERIDRQPTRRELLDIIGLQARVMADLALDRDRLAALAAEYDVELGVGR